MNPNSGNPTWKFAKSNLDHILRQFSKVVLLLLSVMQLYRYAGQDPEGYWGDRPT